MHEDTIFHYNSMIESYEAMITQVRKDAELLFPINHELADEMEQEFVKSYKASIRGLKQNIAELLKNDHQTEPQNVIRRAEMALESTNDIKDNPPYAPGGVIADSSQSIQDPFYALLQEVFGKGTIEYELPEAI